MALCDDYQKARIISITGDKPFIAVSDEDSQNTNGNNSFIKEK